MGFVALGVVALLGLVSALKLVSPATAARLRPWHERLALTGLACTAAHGLLLLADGWLHPGLTAILVPFTMGLLGGVHALMAGTDARSPLGRAPAAPRVASQR